MPNANNNRVVSRIAIGIFAVIGIGTGIFFLNDEIRDQELVRDVSLEMTSDCEERQHDISGFSYGDYIWHNFFLDEGESIRIGDNMITSRGNGSITIDGNETKAELVSPESLIPVRTESFVYQVENKKGYFDNTEVIIRRSCER